MEEMGAQLSAPPRTSRQKSCAILGLALLLSLQQSLSYMGISLENSSQGTSLLVQQLRLHLAMQGTQVRALLKKLRSHSHRATKAHAPQLVSLCTLKPAHHNYRFREPQLESVCHNERSCTPRLRPGTAKQMNIEKKNSNQGRYFTMASIFKIRPSLTKVFWSGQIQRGRGLVDCSHCQQSCLCHFLCRIHT